jgi:excisionase family DNA binding protein
VEHGPSAKRPLGTDGRSLVAYLEQVVADVSVSEIPALLADLERFRLTLWARWVTGVSPAASNGFSTNGESLLSVSQAARFLGISRTALRRLEAGGHLTGVRIGRRLLFRKETLVRFAEDRERGGTN